MWSHSLFNFWKIKKQKANVIINKKNPKGKKILELCLNKKIRPSWLKEKEKVKILFPNIYESKIKGEVLAYFDNRKTPAIIQQDNKIIFNFDPDETINYLIFEKYYKRKRPFYTYLPFHYHLFSGDMRTFLNRIYLSTREKEIPFPSWPLEKSVEVIRWVFLNCLKLNKKIKQVDFWPNGKKYTLCLTHDVETKMGLKKVKILSRIEESYGLTSLWNIVGKHYGIDFSILDNLVSNGHEIGLHGYNHDNKIAFLSERNIRKRISKCYRLIKRYNIAGFRSPSLIRSEKLFNILQDYFSYDSSIPDTERFSQISMFNGCCTVFPFKIGNLVELPLTLPQDARLLFEGYKDEEICKIWIEKLEWIKKVGGIAIINTHPEPHLCGDEKMAKIYRKFIERISNDKDGWITNPINVVKWWKKREKL